MDNRVLEEVSNKILNLEKLLESKMRIMFCNKNIGYFEADFEAPEFAYFVKNTGGLYP